MVQRAWNWTWGWASKYETESQSVVAGNNKMALGQAVGQQRWQHYGRPAVVGQLAKTTGLSCWLAQVWGSQFMELI